MTTISMPTLSSLSYAKNPPEQAKKTIEYYNESNESQSTLFFGSVYSLAAQIVAHGSDPQALAEAITADLTAMFNKIFNDTTISVTVSDNGNGTYDLYIKGNYTSQDGQRYSLDEAYKRSN